MMADVTEQVATDFQPKEVAALAATKDVVVGVKSRTTASGLVSVDRAIEAVRWRPAVMVDFGSFSPERLWNWSPSDLRPRRPFRPTCIAARFPTWTRKGKLSIPEQARLGRQVRRRPRRQSLVLRNAAPAWRRVLARYDLDRYYTW